MRESSAAVVAAARKQHTKPKCVYVRMMGWIGRGRTICFSWLEFTQPDAVCAWIETAASCRHSRWSSPLSLSLSFSCALLFPQYSRMIHTTSNKRERERRDRKVRELGHPNHIPTRAPQTNACVHWNGGRRPPSAKSASNHVRNFSIYLYPNCTSISGNSGPFLLKQPPIGTK